jgi:molybdopterin converting factor subunit 1
MRVLFFAHLKDLTGCAETRLQIGAPATADDVWRELVALHPALAPARGSVRLARNLEYAGPNEQFTDADEVALIPPVSGG